MEKFIGRTVDIIYMDRHGQFTSRRRIRPISILDDRLKAYDIGKRSPRVFRIENILAVQLVRSA